MNRVLSFVGSFGLGSLAAGVLLFFMQPERDFVWASLLVLGLVLTLVHVVRNWNRLSVLAGRRSAREGANAVLLAIIVGGITIAVNFIADRHAKQWDSTAAKQYTLSDQTMKVVSELESDVAIVLLDDPGSRSALEARDLLKLYDDASGRLSVELLDPEAEPEKALRYQSPTDAGITLGTILVVTADRHERATAATEPEITNALIRAIKPEVKKIYFTEGHRERELSQTDETGLSTIRGKLESSTYETEGLLIARSVVGDELAVPEDADAVVVAGPRSDFLPEEIEALDRYIRGGGKAVFLVDPRNQGETPLLTAYLLELGAVLGDDVIIDPRSRPPVTPVVQSYSRHPIVESFSNVISVFPIARSVSRAEEIPEGVEIQELFSTMDELSWAETRLDELEQRQRPAEDQRTGPIPLAVALTLEENEGRVVVVGDSDFVANDLASAAFLNSDLFMNMINWVARDEELIAIRPKEPEDRRIYMSPQQSRNLLFMAFVILPGILFVTAFSVWWGRR